MASPVLGLGAGGRRPTGVVGGPSDDGLLRGCFGGWAEKETTGLRPVPRVHSRGRAFVRTAGRTVGGALAGAAATGAPTGPRRNGADWEPPGDTNRGQGKADESPSIPRARSRGLLLTPQGGRPGVEGVGPVPDSGMSRARLWHHRLSRAHFGVMLAGHCSEVVALVVVLPRLTSEKRIKKETPHRGRGPVAEGRGQRRPWPYSVHGHPWGPGAGDGGSTFSDCRFSGAGRRARRRDLKARRSCDHRAHRPPNCVRGARVFWRVWYLVSRERVTVPVPEAISATAPDEGPCGIWFGRGRQNVPPAQECGSSRGRP